MTLSAGFFYKGGKSGTMALMVQLETAGLYVGVHPDKITMGSRTTGFRKTSPDLYPSWDPYETAVRPLLIYIRHEGHEML